MLYYPIFLINRGVATTSTCNARDGRLNITAIVIATYTCQTQFSPNSSPSSPRCASGLLNVPYMLVSLFRDQGKTGFALLRGCLILITPFLHRVLYPNIDIQYFVAGACPTLNTLLTLLPGCLIHRGNISRPGQYRICVIG